MIRSGSRSAGRGSCPSLTDGGISAAGGIPRGLAVDRDVVPVNCPLVSVSKPLENDVAALALPAQARTMAAVSAASAAASCVSSLHP